jgi:YfiR/HmsC-like
MARMLSLLLLLGAALQASAQAPVQAFDEYQVKAAFLYNFAKFVEWPPGTFAISTDPIEICIVGQNPFGSALENMVQGKKVGDRTFAVRRFSDTLQASECQILFIGAAEWKRTRALLDAVKSPGVLTVGETDDFTGLGGIISFRLDGPRVRIQVNLQTAEHAKLRISSKLLSLAEITKKQP